MTAPRKPDFLIIGAQKAGTTWLWDMLDRHPTTDLPQQKELFFFSDAGEYRRGEEWYYAHFRSTAPGRKTGEASTDYFTQHVLIDEEVVDDTLPTVPELVHRHLPNVRAFLILRDPVDRAISAYFHHMRRRHYGPDTSLRDAALRYGRLRIVERGLYADPLALWQERFPAAQLRTYLYEDDIAVNSDATLRDAYDFLGIDPSFRPRSENSVNARWGQRQVWLNYRGGRWLGGALRRLMASPAGRFVRALDPEPTPPLPDADIQFLQERLLPEKPRLETLLGRPLDAWHYGAKRVTSTESVSVSPAH